MSPLCARLPLRWLTSLGQKFRTSHGNLLQRPKYRCADFEKGIQLESSCCLAPFYRMRIIEGLGECRKVNGLSDSHKYVEDLVRLAPKIEAAGSPAFRDTCLVSNFPLVPDATKMITTSLTAYMVTEVTYVTTVSTYRLAPASTFICLYP